MNQIFRELQADAVLGLDRKSVVLPARKILISLFQLMFFGFEQKKQQKSSLTSLFKLPDKTLSKEMMNLLISGSVSSPHLNCKHLANVTQQAIAWRYGCVPDVQNDLFCHWETSKTLRIPSFTDMLFKAAKRPMHLFQRHFVYGTMSRSW